MSAAEWKGGGGAVEKCLKAYLQLNKSQVFFYLFFLYISTTVKCYKWQSNMWDDGWSAHSLAFLVV